MMQSITFECEVITPMFLAGADGITPELRPPSIKGALRFWWRALNGHLPLADVKNELGEIIQEGLKTREGEIFGDTNRRSKVLIRVAPIEEKISTNTFKNLNRRAYDLIYMTYGAVDRKYYEVGTKFNIIIASKDNTILNEVKKAFTALVHLGGLGAKSRNGFGSLQCNNIDTFEELKAYDNFHAKIKAPYTSISNNVQIYFSERDFSNWHSAIKELKALYSESKKSIFPKNHRVYIGAPWNKEKQPERHSKIHLMSLYKEENRYYYRITYLPYDYMKGYPEMNEGQITNHYTKWKSTTKKFNELLENAEDDYGNYSVNYTFNKND